MIDVKRTIEQARQRYREDGVTLHLPSRNHVESVYPRASSLGLCPLQSAYQKAKIKPDYATFSENNWLMDHGNYVAPMVQLPLMYWAMVNDDTSFQPEVPFISHEYRVAGRLDGLLSEVWDEQPYYCVIEIKDTEGKAMRSVGEPTLRYGLQTLVYMMVMGISQGAVVTCSKWDYSVWNLQQEDKGFRFYDEDHVPYSPSYGYNWNTPAHLNFDSLKTELNLLNEYLNAVRPGTPAVIAPILEGDGKIIPPIVDPLNDSMGWLCLRKENPNSKKKEGWARPNCLWCQRCHGLEDKFYTTIKDGDQIKFKDKS